MKLLNIITIIGMIFLWQCSVGGQVGCMDRSQHGYRCNYNDSCPCGPDRKQFYYVDCACECWRYPIDKRCRCTNCGHYRKPEQLRVIYKGAHHE